MTFLKSMVRRRVQLFLSFSSSLVCPKPSVIHHIYSLPSLTTQQKQISSIRSYSTKRSASSTRWVNRAKNDIFSRKAKELNMRSRAGFKLEEIDKKFHIFSKFKNRKKDNPDKNVGGAKNGQYVVDLGFAPGAWSQVALKLSHPDSRILGVDILPCKPPDGVSSLQANILSRRTHDLIREFFVRNDEIMRNLRNRGEIKQKYNEQELEENSTETISSQEDKASTDDVKIPDESSKKSTEMIACRSTVRPLREEKENEKVIKKTEGESKNEESESIYAINGKFVVDIVLSDMYDPFPQVTGFWNNTTNTAYYRMANTTGLKAKDHMASMDLCEAGLILCIELLKPGGTYVCKFFSGKEDILLEHHLKRTFEKVVRYKPNSSRSESTEAYFVCMDKRSNVTIDQVYHHD